MLTVLIGLFLPSPNCHSDRSALALKHMMDRQIPDNGAALRFTKIIPYPAMVTVTKLSNFNQAW